jgi:hypothetical protein
MYAANPCSPAVRSLMSEGELICMTTPSQGNRIPDGARVILDNGAFGKGYPGDHAWEAWLFSMRHLADRAEWRHRVEALGPRPPAGC